MKNSDEILDESFEVISVVAKKLLDGELEVNEFEWDKEEQI